MKHIWGHATMQYGTYPAGRVFHGIIHLRLAGVLGGVGIESESGVYILMLMSAIFCK